MWLARTWRGRVEQRLEKLESDSQCAKGFHAWVTDGSTFHPRIMCGFCKKRYEPEQQTNKSGDSNG